VSELDPVTSLDSVYPIIILGFERDCGFDVGEDVENEFRRQTRHRREEVALPGFFYHYLWYFCARRRSSLVGRTRAILVAFADASGSTTRHGISS